MDIPRFKLKYFGKKHQKLKIIIIIITDVSVPFLSASSSTEPRERNMLAVKAFSMSSATASLQHDYCLIGIADLTRQSACLKY